MKKGFTIVEILVVLVFVGVIVALFFIQKPNFDATAKDRRSKTAINAMHYGLEEGFYAANQYYPETISAENLPVVDTELWTDAEGRKVGEPGCDYVYEPANCKNGQCKEYILRAKLEKEDDYIKTNRQ